MWNKWQEWLGQFADPGFTKCYTKKLLFEMDYTIDIKARNSVN